MKMKLLTAVAVLAVALGATSMALADTITISVQYNGGTIVTSGPESGNATIDFPLTNNVNMGHFTSINVSATGSGAQPEPALDSNTIDVTSTGGGTLVIWVTEQGIGTPVGPSLFDSSFTVNRITPGWSVTESTSLGGTPLGSATFLAHTFQPDIFTDITTTAPFSETEKYVIVASGTGQTNDTIDLTGAAVVTPESATLSLMGMGLLGLLGLRKKRVA
jgi:hypothetical protein